MNAYRIFHFASNGRQDWTGYFDLETDEAAMAKAKSIFGDFEHLEIWESARRVYPPSGIKRH